MLTYEAMVRRLVLRGIPLSQAEDIVAASLASNNALVDEYEIIDTATITAEDIEAARQWIIYAPQVPSDIKRMPEARDPDPIF